MKINNGLKCYLFLFFKWCHIKFKPRNYWFFCWFLAATFVPIKGTPTRHLTSIQSFINLGKTFLIISKMKYHTALILGETLRYLLSFSRFWTFCFEWFEFLFLMTWQWKQRISCPDQCFLVKYHTLLNLYVVFGLSTLWLNCVDWFFH